MEDFFSYLCTQTDSVAHLVLLSLGTGGPSPRDKVQPGHHANRSPPSSAEVKKEYELYLHSM
jgi:hypothetical protein